MDSKLEQEKGMKPMEVILTLCIGIAIGAVVMYAFTPKPPADPGKPQPQIAIGDITDLVSRLKPLAKHPNDDWGGVRVTITGASVSVEVTTPDGNEYKGKGKTLRAATTMIDSSRIREALAGWSPQ